MQQEIKILSLQWSSMKDDGIIYTICFNGQATICKVSYFYSVTVFACPEEESRCKMLTYYVYIS